MKKKVFLLAALSLLSTMALANDPKQNPSSAQRLSFSDFRTACLNPQKFHNQVPPTNIQVACRDVQTRWVPAADGSLSMTNGRKVTTAVSSDKYTSDAITAAVGCAGQVAACPRYKQVYEAVETVRAVTCDDLVAFTGSAVEYCTDVINSLRASNPAAVAVSDTGQVADVCGSFAQRK